MNKREEHRKEREGRKNLKKKTLKDKRRRTFQIKQLTPRISPWGRRTLGS